MIEVLRQLIQEHGPSVFGVTLDDFVFELQDDGTYKIGRSVTDD
jgi:hypothetical protein